MTSAFWLSVILAAILVNVASILVIAVREAQNSATALTWIVVSTVLPLVGIILYASLSQPVPRRRTLIWAEHEQEAQADHAVLQDSGEDIGHDALSLELHRGLADVSSPVASGELEIYGSGDEFYSQLLEDIDRARASIDMEFYIFRWDEIGQAIVHALIRRATAGVYVRFLRDGLGDLKFPRHAVARMLAAGIDVRVFFPVHLPFPGRTLNHRDHCKIVVIDQQVAYVGGMNVGLEYTGRKPGKGPWRDTQVRILGKPARQTQRVFESDWSVSTRPKIKLNTSQVSAVHGYSRISEDTGGPPRSNPALDRQIQSPCQTVVQFVDSGPDHRRTPIREAFFLCLTQAQTSIDITTPYFIPGEDIIMALKSAVARGVRVRLLLPARVDHRLTGWACQTYFEDLLYNGIQIFLWQPGVLHAKVITVDDHVSIVGAANYDLRSFRLNYEICMIGYGGAFAARLANQFERDLLQSTPLTRADIRHVSRLRHTIHQAARLLAPML